MELQFLGTGAGQPSKARNVSSLVLKLLDEINEVWMFDCGEGTQRQILETTIKPRKVKKSLLHICTGTISSVYQVSWRVVPSNLAKNKLTLKFMDQLVLSNTS
jgi:RNase_Z: ribonuclease Z